jgi:hypothetical protein
MGVREINAIGGHGRVNLITYCSCSRRVSSGRGRVSWCSIRVSWCSVSRMRLVRVCWLSRGLMQGLMALLLRLILLLLSRRGRLEA